MAATGRSRGARRGSCGLLPRALLLVVAAAAAVQHASAAGVPTIYTGACQVIIRPTVSNPDTSVVLNLAEVELFDATDVKIASSDLNFTLSSTLMGVFVASYCNDGFTTSGGVCHTDIRTDTADTISTDPYPSLTITFPCASGLSKVVVWNRASNLDRINAFTLDAIRSDGTVATSFQFTGSQQTYTISGIGIQPASANPVRGWSFACWCRSNALLTAYQQQQVTQVQPAMPAACCGLVLCVLLGCSKSAA
ncbi:MAG: hypothetical protein J3K34DRAFT_488072 [Monoraphidium minutum]|nr:MAG: hypothetical protein J3K34DRAFT_488072 [Monoraphidium minutum]